MSNMILDARTASKVKALLTFSKTFIYKDVRRAAEFETENSIVFSSYYLDAVENRLPWVEEFSHFGFASSMLREYNIPDNHRQFYIDSFRQNTLYVGDSDERFKEVRSAAFNANANTFNSDYVGNVFELNQYYRMLYCTFGIDPAESRSAGEFEIIGFSRTSVPDGVDVNKFIALHTENCKMFLQSMENVAFYYDSRYRSFCTWTILLMTITAYLDSELTKAFDVSLYDMYDIRNALYGFGITYCNDLPAAFQLRLLKNIRRLVKAKGTNEVFDIIIKDVFGKRYAQAYRYYLLKKDELSKLEFIRVPYDVSDIHTYMITHREVERIPYEDIITADADYWHATEAEVKAAIGTEQIIQTKYVDTYTITELPEDTEGAIMLFGFVHEASPAIGAIYASGGVLSAEKFTLFGAIVTLYYILCKSFYLNSAKDARVKPKLVSSLSLQNPSIKVMMYILHQSLNESSSYVLRNTDSALFSHTSADEISTIVDTLRARYTHLVTPDGFALFFNKIFKDFRDQKHARALIRAEDDCLFSNGFILQESDSGSKTIDAIDEDGMPRGWRNSTRPSGDKIFLQDNGILALTEDTKGFANYLEAKVSEVFAEKLYKSSDGYSSQNYEIFDTMGEYVKAYYPAAFAKIEKFSGASECLSAFISFSSDILMYLNSIGITEGVSFEPYMRSFLSAYVTKLVEKFISYTVQLKSAGYSIEINDGADESINLFDHIQATDRHVLQADWIKEGYTFKNSDPYDHDLGFSDPIHGLTAAISVPHKFDSDSGEYTVGAVEGSSEENLKVEFDPYEELYGYVTSSYGVFVPPEIFDLEDPSTLLDLKQNRLVAMYAPRKVSTEFEGIPYRPTDVTYFSVEDALADEHNNPLVSEDSSESGITVLVPETVKFISENP